MKKLKEWIFTRNTKDGRRLSPFGQRYHNFKWKTNIKILNLRRYRRRLRERLVLIKNIEKLDEKVESLSDKFERLEEKLNTFSISCKSLEMVYPSVFDRITVLYGRKNSMCGPNDKMNRDSFLEEGFTYHGIIEEGLPWNLTDRVEVWSKPGNKPPDLKKELANLKEDLERMNAQL